MKNEERKNSQKLIEFIFWLLAILVNNNEYLYIYINENNNHNNIWYYFWLL